jgi:hypothetical protein
VTENHGVASSILALGTLGLTMAGYAGVVQLVERLLAKEKVVGSSPIARSDDGDKLLIGIPVSTISNFLSCYL